MGQEHVFLVCTLTHVTRQHKRRTDVALDVRSMARHLCMIVQESTNAETQILSSIPSCYPAYSWETNM